MALIRTGGNAKRDITFYYNGNSGTPSTAIFIDPNTGTVSRSYAGNNPIDNDFVTASTASSTYGSLTVKKSCKLYGLLADVTKTGEAVTAGTTFSFSLANQFELYFD